MGTNGALLEIKDLRVNVEAKPILNGIDLTVGPGEVHAIMGPNGSGKSTLANTLMGHPRYEVTSGKIVFKGEDITELAVDKRAQRGLFLAMQYPTAIPGVTMVNLLRAALKGVNGGQDAGQPTPGETDEEAEARKRRAETTSTRGFLALLRETMSLLKMDESFARRYVNDGFSGGEKKRAEVLQMGILKPLLAIMDETDSGLDVDALRTVSEGINALRRPEMSVLLITHYQRMLNYITPDFVHVLYKGRIVLSGGRELALRIEENGYDEIIGDFEADEAVAPAGRQSK